MPTRNVVLTDHQQQVIESLVQSGRYQNASEVLRDGLRLVEERDLREAATLAALRDAVTKGREALDVGDYDEVDSADLADYLARLRPDPEGRASA